MAEKLKHIVSARDFSPQQVQDLLKETSRMEFVRRGKQLENHTGAMLFYEPSNRTRISFDAAIRRLGGEYHALPEPQQTMWSRDTVGDGQVEHVLNSLDIAECRYVVLRHHQVGGAGIASEKSPISIINAGEGFNGDTSRILVEHPTQGLGDLYTIKHLRGLESGLRIALVGDLRNNPAVNSLALLLANFPGICLEYVTAPNTDLSGQLQNQLKEKKLLPVRKSNINDVLSANVIYVAGSNYREPPDMPQIGPEELGKLSDSTIVMHDLLRGRFPAAIIKDNSHLVHDIQESDWIPARMALLCGLLAGNVQ